MGLVTDVFECLLICLDLVVFVGVVCVCCKWLVLFWIINSVVIITFYWLCLLFSWFSGFDCGCTALFLLFLWVGIVVMVVFAVLCWLMVLIVLVLVVFNCVVFGFRCYGFDSVGLVGYVYVFALPLVLW